MHGHHVTAVISWSRHQFLNVFNRTDGKLARKPFAESDVLLNRLARRLALLDILHKVLHHLVPLRQSQRQCLGVEVDEDLIRNEPTANDVQVRLDSWRGRGAHDDELAIPRLLLHQRSDGRGQCAGGTLDEGCDILETLGDARGVGVVLGGVEVREPSGI